MYKTGYFNSKSSVISAAFFQALIVLIHSCQYTVAQLCITKMDIYLDIFITMYRRVELCKKNNYIYNELNKV